jgi:hypothetical protein
MSIIHYDSYDLYQQLSIRGHLFTGAAFRKRRRDGRQAKRLGAMTVMAEEILHHLTYLSTHFLLFPFLTLHYHTPTYLMSGFFSSLGRGSGSKTPKEEPVVDNLTPTSEIYTTPLEGIKPTKKWEYDEEQLKKVSHHHIMLYHS